LARRDAEHVHSIDVDDPTEAFNQRDNIINQNADNQKKGPGGVRLARWLHEHVK
jgi:hypothetical protein